MPIKGAARLLYETDEYKTARAKLRRKARGKCQHCKAKHGSYRKRSKVVLCLRHINGDARDNSEANLKLLCQACHFEAQREEFRNRQITLFAEMGRLTAK
jgi:5-methylcytosine-specific restriction endonuclease McrA